MNLLLNLKMVRPDVPEEILKMTANWFYVLSDEKLAHIVHGNKVFEIISNEYKNAVAKGSTGEILDAFHVLIARAPESMEKHVSMVIGNASYISTLGNCAVAAKRARDVYRAQDRLWKA